MQILTAIILQIKTYISLKADFIFQVNNVGLPYSFLCSRHIWISNQLHKFRKNVFQYSKGYFQTYHQCRLISVSDAWRLGTITTVFQMIGSKMIFYLNKNLLIFAHMFSAVLLLPVFLVNFLVIIFYMFLKRKLYFVKIYLEFIFHLTVLYICLFQTFGIVVFYANLVRILSWTQNLTLILVKDSQFAMGTCMAKALTIL